MILTESRKTYEAMFEPIKAMFVPNERSSLVVNLGERVLTQYRTRWDNEIEKAKSKLKRPDRIAWYLGIVRYKIVEELRSDVDFVNPDFRKEFLKKNSQYRDTTDLASILTNLEHYLSLPIPAIQAFVFRKQTFRDIMFEFVELEDRWADSNRKRLDDDSAPTVIDFGNGWKWKDLQKAYCSDEADAMGHCGNAPRANSGDTILSLRKKIAGPQGDRFEPRLTFILDPNGLLTEMKGRANKKPEPRYHQMITALLLNDRVKGITGGGYKPENNFSLDDLGEDAKEALIKKKPQLGDLLDVYDALGDCDIFRRKLASALGEYDFEYYDIEGDEIILSEESISEFFNHSDMENVVNLSEGDLDMIEWLDFPTIDELFKKIDTGDFSLETDDHYEKLDSLRGRIVRELHIENENALDALIHVFPRSVDRIYAETKKRAVELAKRAVGDYLNNPPKYRGARFELSPDGKNIRVVAKLDKFVSDMTDEEYDDGLIEVLHQRDGIWGRVSDDEIIETTDLGEIDLTVFGEMVGHFLGLFHHDDQLELDL